MKLRKLMEPIRIGNRVLRNRIVMPPLETRLSDPDGAGNKMLADHYAARAKGGAAMVIVENNFIDQKASRSAYMQSSMSSGHHIAGKYLVSQAIKAEGAVAIIQLGHGGRQAKVGVSGYHPVAPSAVPYAGVTPIPLTVEDIIEIEGAFASAAVRAKDAGFDGVEIHGAHGYLITQFLSPLTNKRDDEYGGTADKRGNFARNIIHKTRAAVGKDFIIGFRMSGAEYVDGGLTIEESIAFAKTIEKDVDYLHVSAGNYNSMATYMIASLYVEQAPIVALATAMKKAVQIPVITVGAINPELAEHILANHEADLVSFGRQLIADPELPNKIKEDRLEDIRPCVRGHEGCISLFFKGCPIRCEVNPQVGRDAEYEIKKVSEPKHVVVVGGGMAGMEAARVADQMGHHVTLFEKSGHFGGRFLEATEPSFKQEGRALIGWAETQLQKSKVNVNMNQAVTPEMIQAMHADAVIVATGSEYIQLPIKGIEKALSPDKVLLDYNQAQDTVAIIGGGLIGSETALHLAEHGKKVSIFEMREAIAMEDEPLSQEALLNRLKKNNVDIHVHTKVVEVTKDGLIYSTNGETEVCKAETVIYATGLGPIPSSQFDHVAPQVFKIGDAVRGRKIYECFHEAWHAVRSIQ